MATKKSEAAATPASTEALVLVDCSYGKSGVVVTLPTDDAKAGLEAGVLDLNPDAVAAYR